MAAESRTTELPPWYQTLLAAPLTLDSTGAVSTAETVMVLVTAVLAWLLAWPSSTTHETVRLVSVPLTPGFWLEEEKVTASRAETQLAREAPLAEVRIRAWVEVLKLPALISP